MGFHIKEGYVENPGVCYFVDNATATRGIVFQPDVYTFAEWIAEIAGVQEIVDIGCGWADKLAAVHDRHPEWVFTGIDFGTNINHCRQTYSWGRWIDQDLERPFILDTAGPAVVICSDVIEHVADPAPLVLSMRAIAAAAIIVSTPERDVQYGYDHMGPPSNPCHVREWNWSELAAFLTEEGLTVRHASLTRGNDRGTAMATQLLLCTP